ncbi:hypothetical protein KSS87_007819 [Heliosperma pusillum]|nr:hypothetical protein KSS87_007819 [Heliosperma pusillum]KAH9601936.1 hypothetical protein KSS87_007819 [Heliosperma pusillum]KAH9601938.1 hypothetical protein KSS87_007819 [Heliosperma pusillum]
MQQWVMKQGRLIVHTRSYNATMGNEARKTHCSHKELQCKQWVMKQGRLIVHTTSYNITKGNEARKTHFSHKELQYNNG